MKVMVTNNLKCSLRLSLKCNILLFKYHLEKIRDGINDVIQHHLEQFM